MTTTDTKLDTNAAATNKRKPRRQGARKASIPVFRGLASGERRRTRLSGATMALIEARSSAHNASPSDAIFIAAMTAMGRKKHQLPSVAEVAEIDVELPPAIWDFLDQQAASSKSDLDTIIHTYLGLL